MELINHRIAAKMSAPLKTEIPCSASKQVGVIGVAECREGECCSMDGKQQRQRGAHQCRATKFQRRMQQDGRALDDYVRDIPGLHIVPTVCVVTGAPGNNSTAPGSSAGSANHHLACCEPLLNVIATSVVHATCQYHTTCVISRSLAALARNPPKERILNDFPAARLRQLLTFGPTEARTQYTALSAHSRHRLRTSMASGSAAANRERRRG